MVKPDPKDVDEEENEGDHEEEEVEGPEEEEEEEEAEKEEDEAEEEEHDEEEETDTKPVKKRRCQRRIKNIRICYGEDLTEDEENICEEEEEEDEEEEDEEGEGELWEISSGSSVLSAVSFIWENEVYEFEELCDPGFIKPFQEPTLSRQDVGDEFGVRRYLEMCTALGIGPMASLLRALQTEEMDLSYRNLDYKAIRAISAALEINTSVKRLIARWNDLRPEDCYFLGRIMSRGGITYLDFTGCKLLPDSLGYLVAFLTKNETVTDLILAKCNIQDEGMKTLAYVLSVNTAIENLDLSYNRLESASAEALAAVFMSNSSLVNLNLRYNNLFEPSTMKNFFRYLAANYSITNLNMSWNGMSGEIGSYIGNFLKKNEVIAHLDLSDNRFAGASVIDIRKGLAKSKSLTTLKLGKNPLSLWDIENLVSGVKGCPTLQVLDLEDLWVDNNTLKILKRVQKDREFELIYAGILGNYEVKGPDYPRLILLRAQFEAQKPKQAKKKRDFGHLMWTLGDDPMTKDEFMKRVKKFKAKISKQLFPELIEQFLIPKNNLVDVSAMRKKYLSIFPDSSPPPPPKPKKGKKGKVEVPKEEEELGEEEDELMLGESAGELSIYGEYSDDGEEEEEEEEEDEGFEQ